MNRFAPPFAKTFKHFLPLKPYFIKNRWPLIFGLLSLLLVDGLQVFIPQVIKEAINLLTTQRATTGALLKPALTILMIASSVALFRYIWRYLIFGHSRKVEEALRNRMYRHLQGLSPSFYQRTKTGDLMARAINDINAVRMATGMGLVALMDGIVLGVAAVAFMISINVKLTMIALLPAPIIIVLSRKLTRRMSTGFESVQKAFSDVTERVRETFAGIRVIKAYAREDWAYDRVQAEGQGYISENMHLAKTLAFFFPMMAIFTNAGLAIVIWMGGRLTIMGRITMGDFVAFTSYLNLLTWPMMAMGWVTNLVQRGSASMRRINRILEEVPGIRDSPRVRATSVVRGQVEIRGLSLTISGHQKGSALEEIHLKVDVGETVAFVGHVGSGKSTLLQAIPSLFPDAPTNDFSGWHRHSGIPLQDL